MEVQVDQASFRKYLFFWSGQLVSLLGSSIIQFVIVWWITLETGSTFYLSLAALAAFAPAVILLPVAGVIVDRSNRKTLIIIVDFFQAISTVALISFFWMGIASIWLILAILTARGVCQAFHMPTVQAIIPAMVPRDKLSRMNGLNFLFTGAITLIGPVVAAFLLIFLRISDVLWLIRARS